MCRHQVGDASDFFKMFSASKIQRLGPIKMFFGCTTERDINYKILPLA